MIWRERASCQLREDVEVEHVADRDLPPVLGVHRRDGGEGCVTWADRAVAPAEHRRSELAASWVISPGHAPVRAVLIPGGIERLGASTGLGRTKDELYSEDHGGDRHAAILAPASRPGGGLEVAGAVQMPSM